VKPERSRGKCVTTVQGAYSAIEPNMLLHEVCIVPDFSKPLDETNERQHFLLNDLLVVHLASDDLLVWEPKDTKPTVWFWDKEPSEGVSS
jgi:hypothetical protein